jgi:3-oxoacyl-[acyl-carrier protein] reductase
MRTIVSPAKRKKTNTIKGRITMRLSNKVALITGAASGMGRASAVLFAKEGARIEVVDLDSKGGQETVDEIKRNGGEAIFVEADVSKAADAEKMITACVNTYGKIDILFNNAGVPMLPTPTDELAEEVWDRIMNVNVKGIFLGAKYAIPFMKKQGGGVIINTASISGLRPRPASNAYATSKGAAITLTKALAIELAPFGIRVNSINPVAAETPMLAKLTPPGGEKMLTQSVPLGRLARADDVAYAALYLASDEASMVTGIGLGVDGGRGI